LVVDLGEGVMFENEGDLVAMFVDELVEGVVAAVPNSK
jgi:hypothetical protein